MSTLLDYLPWRGDLTMEASPFGALDALILTQFSYLRFTEALGALTGATIREASPLVEKAPPEYGNAQTIENRHTLFGQAAGCARYAEVGVRFCEDIFDEATKMQFAAAGFLLPDGTLAIAYRGTDATLVGWQEDFNMSFECPVPAQAEAVRYLERVGASHRGPMILCGHSKGGNLAMYAAACCTPELRARIRALYLFDAPGLDARTLQSDGYQQLLPRTQSFVPQTSIIGMLMGIPQRYTVVHSSAFSIFQHNTFTWEILGPRFVTLPQTDNASKLIKSTLDDFLTDSTPAMRKLLVDTVFSLVDSSDARTVGDLKNELAATAGALFTGTRNLDPATRKAVTSILGIFVQSGAESARRLIAEREAIHEALREEERAEKEAKDKLEGK